MIVLPDQKLFGAQFDELEDVHKITHEK